MPSAASWKRWKTAPCPRCRSPWPVGQVVRVVDQQGAEPGQPLGLGAAAEPGAVPLGLQERLLHQVGRAGLGPQVRRQLPVGDQQHVRAAVVQQPAEGEPAAPAGRRDQLFGGRGRAVRHHSLTPGTELRQSGRQSSPVAQRTGRGTTAQEPGPGRRPAAGKKVSGSAADRGLGFESIKGPGRIVSGAARPDLAAPRRRHPGLCRCLP
jgi:hypothetical protein